MIYEFFEFIKSNLSLEKINKTLIFLAIAALVFRVGNFYNSFIPKPFELILALVTVLTAIDLVKNGKLKELWLSISKKNWIAVFCLVFSILLGWFIAVFVKGTQSNFNMILEFGTFSIGLCALLLVVFYTKNDPVYAKRFFYALFLPIFYIFFVLFPGTAGPLLAVDGNFIGFTSNPNIISKTLLIPALFFIAYSLFESRERWRRVGIILISSFLVALIFWISSRGAILSLGLGIVFIWLIFSLRNFNWKKMFFSGIIIVIIVLLGFVLTPKERKKVAINRVLNMDKNQIALTILKEKSVLDVAKESVLNNFSQSNTVDIVKDEKSLSDTGKNSQSLPDTRLQIWSFYLKYVLRNPLGVGPDTHMKSYIVGSHGEYVSSGPHNTYIQIWLWGGLLGLLSFLYILFRAFKNLMGRLQLYFDPSTIALVGILFALSIAIMFDDSLSFYWFWIVLALSLRNVTINQ